MSSVTDSLVREQRALILRALYDAYPAPLGDMLLIDAVASVEQIQLSIESIHRALEYQRGHGRVEIFPRNDFWLARITTGGVIFIESDERRDRLRIGKIQLLRLRVLQSLQLLPMRAMSENMVTKCLRDDSDLDLTPESIHRACAYLCDTGKATWTPAIENRQLRITSLGIDFLEGHGDPDLGLKRPAQL